MFFFFFSLTFHVSIFALFTMDSVIKVGDLEKEAAGFKQRSYSSSESLCKEMNSSNNYHVSVAHHLKYGI